LDALYVLEVRRFDASFSVSDLLCGFVALWLMLFLLLVVVLLLFLSLLLLVMLFSAHRVEARAAASK
jgi:hypothetical protein